MVGQTDGPILNISIDTLKDIQKHRKFFTGSLENLFSLDMGIDLATNEFFKKTKEVSNGSPEELFLIKSKISHLLSTLILLRHYGLSNFENSIMEKTIAKLFGHKETESKKEVKKTTKM